MTNQVKGTYGLPKISFAVKSNDKLLDIKNVEKLFPKAQTIIVKPNDERTVDIDVSFEQFDIDNFIMNIFEPYAVAAKQLDIIPLQSNVLQAAIQQ